MFSCICRLGLPLPLVILLGHTASFGQLPNSLPTNRDDIQLPFSIERTVVRNGFDGKRCWVHARAGIIPAEKPTRPFPMAILTTQPLLLTGSDVFYALHTSTSQDDGRTWSPLKPSVAFERKTYADGREMTVCDFTPKWHSQSKRLLGIGQTVWYKDNRVISVRPRATAYSVYSTENEAWSPWKRLQLPDLPQFANAGSGSAQRFDLANGEILVPIYYKRPEQRQFHSSICRCSFDGVTLKYLEHGSDLTIPVERGLCEPSITQFGDRYYLTLRNDQGGYVTVSENGLDYRPVKPWTFDDGTSLGNYNTQQHWVTHSAGLFLVYTRRGADNDHVFRHRAPLFIARVDPQRLCVLRATEQVLVPERGARLGNFGVTEFSRLESWVTVAEWMQPAGVEQYGSDNSIYIARLKWDEPNQNYAP